MGNLVRNGPINLRKWLSMKELFSAVCASCGSHCSVSFKPDGKRPVYCRECFAAKREEEKKEIEANEALPFGAMLK
jgi:CxxC-x17-CxxC domain-containing protein